MFINPPRTGGAWGATLRLALAAVNFLHNRVGNILSAVLWADSALRRAKNYIIYKLAAVQNRPVQDYLADARGPALPRLVHYPE